MSREDTSLGLAQDRHDAENEAAWDQERADRDAAETRLPDLFIVCFCADNTHPEHEFMQHNDDMGRDLGPLWRDTRAEVHEDRLYIPGPSHVVVRLGAYRVEADS
jgi:hypothetical protein